MIFSQFAPIILFFAYPLMPIENCINQQLTAQAPITLPEGSVRGPVVMLRDASGEIIPHLAQALYSKPAHWPNRNTPYYKVQFTTPEPNGWRLAMVNRAIGVYADTIGPQVEVLDLLNDTPIFQVDISSCLPQPNLAPE